MHERPPILLPGEILRFPKVPELDWIKALAEQYRLAALNEGDKEFADRYAEDSIRLSDLHSYLKWSRIYGLTHGMSKEHFIANGIITKFHRRVFNMALLPGEQALITRSEEALQASNAEIKRRKNANPG